MPASALAAATAHDVAAGGRDGRELLRRLAGRRRPNERSRATGPDPAEQCPARPPDGPASGLHLPGVQRRAVGAARGRARALPLPRRPLLLRGRDGRRPGQRRRGRAVGGARGARGAQRAAAADRRRAWSSQPAHPAALPRRRARGRGARRDHPPHPARHAGRALHERGRPAERRRTRPSRRCWSSSSAAAGSTSRATSARACSAASGAGWRRSAASPSATTSTTSRSTRDEYEQLFEMLLINVTEFFRDPPAWEHLRDGGAARAARRQGAGRAGARVERGLRERPGGLHGGDGASPSCWASTRSASA